MATAATDHPTATRLPARMAVGAAGGLAGGVVFGIMMQMMGMIPMVAMLVGSKSPAVGWVVHLAISAVIGAGYGLVAARLTGSLATHLAAGAGYGALWWILGPLLLMPARLGMPTLSFSTAVWRSLAGHLIFGLIVGAVVAAGRRRVGSR